MKYYKKKYLRGADTTLFIAVPSDHTEMMISVLQITLTWPSIYWVERLEVFIEESLEPIDQNEFDQEYQRAIETFNSFLKPEKNG